MHGPVLLTGGSGFLGSHIADRLVAEGREVRALGRDSSDVRHLASLPGVTLTRGSLGDPASLANAVRGVGGVVHAGALIKARGAADFDRTNAQGTRNLLQAAANVRPAISRFVHVSSLAAVGPSHDGLPRESGTPPAPLTAYGRSKLAAEESVTAASEILPTVTIRPPVVYGPGDREVLAFFRAVRWGVLPLTGSPDSVLSLVYATDCAAACVQALEADTPSGAVYDVEDGAPVTLGQMLGAIEAALGTQVRVRIPIPPPVLYLAAVATEAMGWVRGRPAMLTRDKFRELRAPHWVCDGSSARSALGWTPEVTFPEGARRSARWYQEAGWL